MPISKLFHKLIVLPLDGSSQEEQRSVIDKSSVSYPDGFEYTQASISQPYLSTYQLATGINRPNHRSVNISDTFGRLRICQPDHPFPPGRDPIPG